MNQSIKKYSNCRPPLWAIILIALLFANVIWAVWRWAADTEIRAIYRQFKISKTNDNNVAVIGITDLKTGKFVWTRSDFVQRDTPVEDHGFYFNGEQVFGVWSKSNFPPIYSVYFRSPEKGITLWQNRGGADTFTQRTIYDNTGAISREEVWYENAWHLVDRRNGTNGIIISAQWQPLAFAADGLWTTEASKK